MATTSQLIVAYIVGWGVNGSLRDIFKPVSKRLISSSHDLRLVLFSLRCLELGLNSMALLILTITEVMDGGDNSVLALCLTVIDMLADLVILALYKWPEELPYPLNTLGPFRIKYFVPLNLLLKLRYTPPTEAMIEGARRDCAKKIRSGSHTRDWITSRGRLKYYVEELGRETRVPREFGSRITAPTNATLVYKHNVTGFLTLNEGVPSTKRTKILPTDQQDVTPSSIVEASAATEEGDKDQEEQGVFKMPEELDTVEKIDEHIANLHSTIIEFEKNEVEEIIGDIWGETPNTPNDDEILLLHPDEQVEWLLQRNLRIAAAISKHSHATAQQRTEALQRAQELKNRLERAQELKNRLDTTTPGEEPAKKPEDA